MARKVGSKSKRAVIVFNSSVYDRSFNVGYDDVKSTLMISSQNDVHDPHGSDDIFLCLAK